MGVQMVQTDSAPFEPFLDTLPPTILASHKPLSASLSVSCGQAPFVQNVHVQTARPCTPLWTASGLCTRSRRSGITNEVPPRRRPGQREAGGELGPTPSRHERARPPEREPARGYARPTTTCRSLDLMRELLDDLMHEPSGNPSTSVFPRSSAGPAADVLMPGASRESSLPGVELAKLHHKAAGAGRGGGPLGAPGRREGGSSASARGGPGVSPYPLDSPAKRDTGKARLSVANPASFAGAAPDDGRSGHGAGGGLPGSRRGFSASRNPNPANERPRQGSLSPARLHRERANHSGGDMVRTRPGTGAGRASSDVRAVPSIAGPAGYRRAGN